MAVAMEAANGGEKSENLETLIDTIQKHCVAGSVTEGVRVEDLMNAIGRRAYGPLLLLIGLLAISPASLLPGSTLFFAFITFVIAGQMALGLKKPWLPRKVLQIKMPARQISDGLEKARPMAAGIDRFIKPRLELLAKPPFVTLIALACVAAALVTVPLSFVPFAPFLPSAAIMLFGLGMTARDGLLLALGLAVFGGAAATLYPMIF